MRAYPDARDGLRRLGGLLPADVLFDKAMLVPNTFWRRLGQDVHAEVVFHEALSQPRDGPVPLDIP
jgi:hypothetical protein